MTENIIRFIGWVLFTLATCHQVTYADEISFEDVTDSAGIDYIGQSKGSAWGDVNGDGWPDLWMTNRYADFQLYINNGDGTFSNGSAVIVAATNKAYGAAWADFDNDGDMDILTMGPGQLSGTLGQGIPNVFLVNEADRLVDRASEYGVEYRAPRGRTPLWFDWNNDGLLDLLLANEARSDGIAPTALFTQDGNSFTDTTIESSISSKSSLFAQLGRLAPGTAPHLFLHYVSQDPVGLYDYSDLPFQDRREELDFPIVSRVQDVAIADINGDQLTDFFLVRALRRSSIAEQVGQFQINAAIKVNQDQRSVRFKSPGNATFQIFGNLLSTEDVYVGADGSHPASLSFVLPNTDPSIRGIYPHEPGVDNGIFIGFENATGHWEIQLSGFDIIERRFMIVTEKEISNLETIGFLSSAGEKPDRLIVQTTDGFIDATAMAGLDNQTPCISTVAGDFDNDMDLDLYLVCLSPVGNRPNLLYENLGSGSFRLLPDAGGAAGSSSGRGESATIADYDQDGFLDLSVTNGEGGAPFGIGPHQLFRNLGNQNHWIQIDLVGIQSNRDGIGAQVLATAGGVTQIREQNAGMHRFSQNAQRLHFGLANNARISKLKVNWPSGIAQEILSLPADQIIQVIEPSYPSVLGEPQYSAGQAVGVYLWKETFDGSYHLRVSGNGPPSVYEINILADQPFTSVVPIKFESNDELDWSDNYVSFISRVSTGEDGIDFLLPAGVEALIAIKLAGHPNPRQLHVGSFGHPITPTGWTKDVDQLPPIPTFQPGENLGLFLGTGYLPGEVLARWNGDGNAHTAALKIIASDSILDVHPVSFESCCDSLVEEDRTISVSATMSSGWDGLDILLSAGSTIGISYHQDGLFQSHRVNGQTRDLGQPNAYALPLPTISGAPIYNPTLEKGFFIWQAENGICNVQCTAGGENARYQGAIISSLPVISALAVSLEQNDVLQVSSDRKLITFDLKVSNGWRDGIKIDFAEDSAVSLELNGNTFEAATLVNVGHERWPIQALPVVLVR